MKEPATAQFLDLKSYRRKRLIDAAKLLPIFGVVCFIFPLPLLFVTAEQADAWRATPLAVYFFIVWSALVAMTFILSRVLAKSRRDD